MSLWIEPFQTWHFNNFPLPADCFCETYDACAISVDTADVKVFLDEMKFIIQSFQSNLSLQQKNHENIFITVHSTQFPVSFLKILSDLFGDAFHSKYVGGRSNVKKHVCWYQQLMLNTSNIY